MSEFIAELVYWLNGASPDLLLGIVELSLRALLLLAGAWAVALLLKHCPASQRHALWSVAIAMAVLLPLLTTIVPALHLPLPSLAGYFTPEVPESFAEAEVSTRISMLPFGEIHSTEPFIPPLSWESITLLLWAAGTSLVVLWLLAGRLRAWLLIRRAAPLPHGRLTELAEEVSKEYNLRNPRVYLSAETEMPMVVGVLRPALLVPTKALKWNDFQLRTMLLHELAHVQRGDMLTHAPAFAALALHWLNPLAWLATRRQVFERELAADEAVLSKGVRASDYAEHLLSAAGRVNGLRFAPGTTAGMARGADFKRRVLHILGSTPERGSAKRRNVAMTIIAIILMSLPIAAWQPWVAEEPVFSSEEPVTEPLPDLMPTKEEATGVNNPKQQKEEARKPVTKPLPGLKATTNETTTANDPQLPKEENRKPGAEIQTEETLGLSDKTPTPAAQELTQPTASFSGVQPFPLKAKVRRQNGHVEVRLLIRKDGSWEFVDILKEDPEGFGFGDAMKRYLKQSKWEPGTKDGEPTDMYYTLAMNFTLREAGSRKTVTIPTPDVDEEKTISTDIPEQEQDKERPLEVAGEIMPPEVTFSGAQPFPAKAKEMARGGQVKIRLIIRKNGDYEIVRIEREDPPGFGFGDAMKQYLKQSTWKPATLEGKPIDVYFDLTVNFMLTTKTKPMEEQMREWEERKKAEKSKDGKSSAKHQDDEIYDAGIGGTVQEPKLIKRVEPNYPETARREKVDGFVLVEAILDKKGNVESIKILQAPEKRYGFAEEAKKAVSQWKFSQTTVKGKPVKVRIRFSVEFNMVNKEPNKTAISLPAGVESEEGFELPEPTFRGVQPYPTKAKVLRRAGQVKMRLLIHADGSWEFLELLRVDPENFDFDRAAMNYLERSSWKPAIYDGKPVDYIYDFTLNFSLGRRYAYDTNFQRGRYNNTMPISDSNRGR